MKVVALVPIKLNNERVPGKNIKCFSDGTPLMNHIQKTLKQVEMIDEVYVYCSDEKVKDYLIDGVKYKKRDVKYDTASADVNDMFYTFSNEVYADIYVLAHATAPFLKAGSIENGIKKLIDTEHDSAMSVKEMKEFFWQDGKPVNYDVKNIPRTQDLKPYYVETTGLYIYKREVIQNNRSRIGNNPYMLSVDEIEAIDINYGNDFLIADAIYMSGITK